MTIQEIDNVLRAVLQDVGGVGLLIRSHADMVPTSDETVHRIHPHISYVYQEFQTPTDQPHSPMVSLGVLRSEICVCVQAADAVAQRLAVLRKRYGASLVDGEYEHMRRVLADTGITSGYHLLLDEPLQQLDLEISDDSDHDEGSD